MRTHSHATVKLLKDARARAYRRYYIWLTQHPDIREDLRVSSMNFKKK